MLEAKCDYLEFTCEADRLADVLSVLPGGSQALDRGWRGYTQSALVAGDKGRVGWHPERPEMGVHVSLGSQALGVLAGLDEAWSDQPAVVSMVQDELGAKVTRFDVAFDDFDGVLDMGVIEDACRSGDYVSRWRRKPRIQFDCETGGVTCYLGSAASDAFCLIYDKRAEREHYARRGKCEPFEGQHWVRVELRLRRGRANSAASLFKRARENASSVMRHLAGVLRHYLEFKSLDSRGDSNKQRRPVADWWLAFLGGVERARLAVVEAEARTIEDVQAWFSRQVSPSVALLEDALGFDRAWSFVYAEAQQARLRYKPRHRAILAASAV